MSTPVLSRRACRHRTYFPPIHISIEAERKKVCFAYLLFLSVKPVELVLCLLTPAHDDVHLEQFNSAGISGRYKLSHGPLRQASRERTAQLQIAPGWSCFQQQGRDHRRVYCTVTLRTRTGRAITHVAFERQNGYGGNAHFCTVTDWSIRSTCRSFCGLGKRKDSSWSTRCKRKKAHIE